MIYYYFSFFLFVGIWGITVIKEGLEKRNTANFDSYSREYYNMDDMYFKKYAFSISVVISGPHIDFSNVKTQEQIEIITKALESSKFIDENLTESWLRDFLDYIKRNEVCIYVCTTTKYVVVVERVVRNSGFGYPQKCPMEKWDKWNQAFLHFFVKFLP